MIVTGRSFIPPVQKTTCDTSQMKATQTVEAPCVTTVMQPTGQDVSDQIATDRPEVQPSGPAIQTLSSASGRSEVQPQDTTGQTVAVKNNQFTSLTGTTTALSDEPDSDGEHFSDHTSHTRIDEECEVSDLESAGPDHE